jgi:alpha/beta superfamily hydrolase
VSAQPNHRIEFEGAQGDMLAARLDMPEGPVRAYALFAHCFTCGKDLTAAYRIAHALAERGIAVLRFDFTGLGHSEGEFANTNFSSNVEDLVRAAAWLREHHRAPALLIGHSLGGAAVLAAAPAIPESKAVVTIAAPSEPKHLERILPGAIDEIERDGAATVQLAGRSFTMKRQFLEDIRAHKLQAQLPELGRALLVMHSPKDELLGLEHAHGIFTAARHPKSFLSLVDADHLLTNADDADYAASMIAAWADRHLPATPIPDPGPSSPQP